MTAHKEYCIKKYDTADDGPEVALINFFLANPKGVSWKEYGSMKFIIRTSGILRCDSNA
jgi:hypothetical protein